METIKIDKYDGSCIEERLKLEHQTVDNTEESWNQFQEWYSNHCSGCKYEYVICMYGEDGF